MDEIIFHAVYNFIMLIASKLKTIAFLFFILFNLVLAQNEQKPVVTDKAGLTSAGVEQIIQPETVEEIVKAVKNSPGPISIGGARYSQVGPTEGALFIDMRRMNRILEFSPDQKLITVEAGITWKKVLDFVDQYNLSPQGTPTYYEITVGGSLSTNTHNRDQSNSLIHSVKSIEVVLANGERVVASRTENFDIFRAAIGGYGGIGIITKATLELTDNVKMERRSAVMPIKNYAQYFIKNIKNNPNVVIHNAYIETIHYNEVRAVTWFKTDKPLTETDRLRSDKEEDNRLQRAKIQAQETRLGKLLRQDYEAIEYSLPKVVWRNWETFHSVKELPVSDDEKAYTLEEYFVPVDRFNEFILQMRKILLNYDINVLNLSVRHANPDSESFLSWAPKEVFSVVLFSRQEKTKQAQAQAEKAARELIDAASAMGGTYYLPYQRHATEDQFRRAYPGFDEWIESKKEADPFNKFRNKLWDKYYPEKPAPVIYYLGPRDTGRGPSILNQLKELAGKKEFQVWYNYYDEYEEDKNGRIYYRLPGSREIRPLVPKNKKEPFYIFINGKPVKSLQDLP